MRPQVDEGDGPDEVQQAPLALPRPAEIKGYFRRLWRGDDGLVRILVVHMAVRGTLVNLATFSLALLLFAFDLPTWLALTVYFSPLPYNVFLLLCVWRASTPEGSRLAVIGRPLAVLWFFLVALI